MGASVMSFDDVIGQSPIVRWCKATVANKAMPQVSLFVGPSGVGKSSTAKLLACEIAANGDDAFCADLKDKIIKQKINVYESVHIYNMSNLDQSAVLEVREDLNTAFSKTGVKVIIMDEAHGMREDAQDTLLTAFEALPEGVHIIICTTDRSKLKPALLSRCVVRYFMQLNTNEMRSLIRLRLDERRVSIYANETIVENYLIAYAGHDARAINNIIDQLPIGSNLSMDDLEMYVPIYEPKAVLQLVRYLFEGNVIAGLNLIPDLSLDETFQKILIDILRTALGDETQHFSREDARYIGELCGADAGRLTGFIIDCTKQKLTIPRLSALFLYWNVNKPESAVSVDSERVLIEDIKNMEIKPVEVPVRGIETDEVLYENFEDFLGGKMIVTE